jgi:two-component system, NtrC family, sensor histidine kinase HydH
MADQASSRQHRPLNLTRRFAVLSFALLSVISAAMAVAVTHFLSREILARDAVVTAQIIQSLGKTEGQHYKLGPNIGELLDDRFDAKQAGVTKEAVEAARDEFLDHFRDLPEVLLANVFSHDRRIVWSSNPTLIGRKVGANEELDKAFAEHVVVARAHTDPGHSREEQAFLAEPAELFSEVYIPLADRKGGVATVLEVYKDPESLLKTIREGYVLVWGVALIATLLSYFVLYWVIRRAALLISRQQQQIVDSETLVVIGEMSSAVAHSIRSPLASIRSSAELGLEGEGESIRKNLRDIITQSDRIGRWLRDLLVFSRPLSGNSEPVALQRIIREAAANFESQLDKAKVRLDVSGVGAELPRIHGNPALIVQVFNSVIANAIEAMPGGGTLRIAAELSRQPPEVVAIVADTGAGMPAKQLEQVFKPFYTTKRGGLGLGLALVKRIMEGLGGAVRIASREGQGTEVRLLFKLAR